MQSFIRNTISKTTKILLTTSILSLTIICSGINAYAEDSNLFKIISEDSQFSILKEAIQKIGLESNLSKADGDKYTILAPNNQAFEKLPKPILENLLKEESKDSLSKLLNYHLLSGVVNGVQIVSSKTVKTLEGSELNIKLTSSQILLNDKVNLSKIDIKASNGVLHIIDEVLTPGSINVEALGGAAASNNSQMSQNSQSTQSNQSNQSNSMSQTSASENSTEASPATTETPRTGASFVVSTTVLIMSLIGAGLRFIIRPVRVKND